MADSRGKVLIVGGGIAGMSLAIRMRARNWTVDLVEIDPQWRVYGAGISITGPTYRAARRLGIADELIARGFGSHKGVRIGTASGQIVAEMPARPIEPGLPTAGGIMRPILHEILSSRTRAAGANVRLGVTLKSFEQRDGKVLAETTDGKSAQYDLIVGADGVYSKLRSLLFPTVAPPKYTGQYCWRLVADRPPEIDGVHFYMAGTTTAGVMPTSDKQMYMFLLAPEPDRIRIDEAGQWQRLKEIMSPYSGLIGSLRDGLSAQSAVIVRPLEAILLPLPWHKGRVCLIGDAVHATTPHLASGAGIAMEDALILSDELGGDTGVEVALTRFEERRWERCRLVVENSVRIGQMELTHADPAALKALMAESEIALRRDI
jgi:2-polyprenyl-6-methoxyphenol hydroxylase-like FAD-dependent oxidoreductase